MRIFWEAVERADRLVFKTLDVVDRKLKRPPLLERTQEATKDVKTPQRVIEFDS